MSYEEYMVQFKRAGEWKRAYYWWGGVIPIVQSKQEAGRNMRDAIARWEDQGRNNPMPSEWRVVHRTVTMTDWIEGE